MGMAKLYPTQPFSTRLFCEIAIEADIGIWSCRLVTFSMLTLDSQHPRCLGHFWTVVRETEDKQNSSRRRARNNNNNTGTRLGRCSSGKLASSTLKGKGRQSVSSDSGVMSDESQANSPTVLLLDGTPVRKDTLGAGNGTQLSTVASMPQLHRPAPAYPDQQSSNRSHLLAAMALNSLVSTPTPTTPSVSEGFLGQYNDFASSVLMNSALLAHANNNNSIPVSTNSISIPTSRAESVMTGLNESNNIEQLQRLQMLNSSLYQNNAIVNQAINQAQLFEQHQQQIQSASLLINQLLALKAQLSKPAAPLFMPQQQTVIPQQPTNGLQQHLLQLISQQILQSNQLTNHVHTTNVDVTDEPTDPTTSKNEDLDLVV
jgi:hypothetical protein